MATIIITSKLTENQQARLRRSAEKQGDYQVADSAAFVHVARNEYARLHDDEDNPTSVHDVARRMMVVAGTTFDYEVR